MSARPFLFVHRKADTAASMSTMGAGDEGIGHWVVLVPPLLLLRMQRQYARLNPDVAEAVCHGSTLDDDDDSRSKH